MGFIYPQVVMKLFRVQVLPHKYPMFAVYVGIAVASAPMRAPGLVVATDVGSEKGTEPAYLSCLNTKKGRSRCS